jgi:beta-glucosidase
MSVDKDAFPFWDMTLDLETRVEDLLNRLTLEEKFALLSGTEKWKTKPITRLGVPSLLMTDGPHGVAPHRSNDSDDFETTYFASAICMAATWNPDLLYAFGTAIAQEVHAIGFHMLLAPGMNIDRTPMNGRTFEYLTEDPYLNKKMASQTVRGIQSQRVAACIKHFAANNQDTHRYSMSSQVSDRALHEIYLPAFKECVEKADAWALMSCYNRINGIYGSAHKELVRDTLMNKWGFRGCVVSDWGATKPIKKVEDCINAGLSLEMPEDYLLKPKRLAKAFKLGKFTIETLNDNIRRLLRLIFLVGLLDNPKTIPQGSRNTPEHQQISHQIGAEGCVLLKNEQNILPLDKSKIKRIAVIGPNADKKMAFGGGSSIVKCPYEITPLEGLRTLCGNQIQITSTLTDVDAAIVVVGLNHDLYNDCEGRDRKNFELPISQIELIQSTSQQVPKTIVVLINGSPVSMDPWLGNVPVVIEAWYGGMQAGKVIAQIIFGELNPEGKLPLTFPRKLADSPAHTNSPRTYPGIMKLRLKHDKVYYDEDVFVGYRYFEANGIKPLFPFGFGLSYTKFAFSNLKLDKDSSRSTPEIHVSVDVKNIGDREGKEVVQLYVQPPGLAIKRPKKELKGFQKISLLPGEIKTVALTLSKLDCAYYDSSKKDWVVEKGIHRILVGNSSDNITCSADIQWD